MPLSYLPLRWESTGDQWWFATPIDWAAAKGHYDLVRELLSLDTNLLIKLTSLRRIRRLETVWDDEDESNTIAKNRSIVAQNLFLECEPNKTRKAHNTLIRAGYGGWLLYTACSAADVAFVQKLLRIDSSLVFGEGEYGITDILYAAARSKDSGVFRFLLDVSGSQKEIEGKSDENRLVFRSEMMNRAAHAAARGGNVEMLREIIGNNSGDVLGFRDAQGSTVLHSASARGQVEVVKYLITTYNIITSTDNQGNTALHVAAYRGNVAVVKVLLSFSPSIISITNNYGDTFLHMIIAGFRSPGFRRVDHQNELIKEVIKGKYINIEDMINARNNNGRTALHMAVNMNIKSEIVELLMSVFGINVNIRDNNGMTPLDLLKQGPKSASSEILIRRLISAGGISKSEDRVVRNALVSHLKMNGIGASPGTSFRVSDSEIFLYAGLENEIKPVDSENIENMDFSDLSGEISKYNSPIRIKTPSSSDNAKMRLKRVFWSKKRDKNDDSGSSLGDDSESSPTPSPIPLRKRFTKHISLPNSESVTPLRNSIPSPSTKKMVPAQLMHSPLSDSSRASPISNSSGKQRSLLGKVIEKSTFSNLSFRVEKSRDKSREIKKNASFDRKLMNRYLCFGSHGLPLEDTIGGDGAHKSYNPSSSIMT